jgi:monothiol glutaredoxin
MQGKTRPCYATAMVVAPTEPPFDRDSGAVVVFAVEPNVEQAATLEMVERCQRHGVDPLVLDASTDPWFAEHLKDPRTREHFPLLCVRGGLVGGIEVVRQLDARHQLELMLLPDAARQGPRIALGRSAAEKLKCSLVEPGHRIRIVITAQFEHDLAVDVPQPGDLELMLGDLPVILDAESASRADGLAIDWVDSGELRGFSLDNPNRPAAVQIVDRAWLEHEGHTRKLLVIDVRTAAEYATGHIDQARLLDATLIDALEKLDPRTPLLFYCNGGIRSRKAAERYRERGFEEIYCLSEGPATH